MWSAALREKCQCGAINSGGDNELSFLEIFNGDGADNGADDGQAATQAGQKGAIKSHHLGFWDEKIYPFPIRSKEAISL